MPQRLPFLRGRRQCIFCERQPPNVKITKEHIFADWLKDLFPRDSETTHTHGVITWALERRLRPATSIKTTRGQGHSGSKKVRAVCRECNQTWLSTSIENTAKPILTSLISGRSGIITPHMQRLLATWAAKTTMTSEHVNRNHAVIRQSERTWIKDKLEPPPGWFIWIAPYCGTQWRNLGIFQHSGSLLIPSDHESALTEHNLGLTFIGMGHLFFLVRNSSWARLWSALGSPVPHVHQIWPVSPIFRWPPPYVFTDIEAEYFTTYLSRVFNHPA